MTEGAPGWDAIDAALRAIYGAVEPRHYASPLPMSIGGNDPLHGISAYPSSFGGRPHWHLVTYGYSELFEKESDDPEVSGYGFEMTLRVIDPEASGDEPPAWALSLLQNLARYVFKSGNVFEPGHYTTLNGPIALGRDTLLVAAVFAGDPELAGIDTPNGRVEFVQLVGLTANEYDAIREWDSDAMLALMAERDRALTTDLARASLLDDPAIAARVSEGTARDGSSMGAVYGTQGSFDGSVLGVAANSLDDLGRLVRGRLAFGREATLIWPGGAVTLAAGEATSVDGDRVTLDAQDRAAILAIPVTRGDYPLPSKKLVIRVIPIEILDGARKRVERTIG